MRITLLDCIAAVVSSGQGSCDRCSIAIPSHRRLARVSLIGVCAGSTDTRRAPLGWPKDPLSGDSASDESRWLHIKSMCLVSGAWRPPSRKREPALCWPHNSWNCRSFLLQFRCCTIAF